MSPQRAAELISRFFRRERTMKEVAVGIYDCPVCGIWTDDPSKHRHGEFLE